MSAFPPVPAQATDTLPLGDGFTKCEHCARPIQVATIVLVPDPWKPGYSLLVGRCCALKCSHAVLYMAFAFGPGTTPAVARALRVVEIEGARVRAQELGV